MAESATQFAENRVEAYGDELPPGARLCQGQYTIERFLNSGGFGITYLARDSLGRKVVIKECFPAVMCCRSSGRVHVRSRSNEAEFEKILDLFGREARALSELNHPYIVGVHQIFRDNGTAYMAMDYVEGQDLLQVIEETPDRLGPEGISRLLVGLLDAVSYMHERGILHRDISPDNILLAADDSPVLIDFGAAREGASRVSRVLSQVMTVKDGYSPQEFYISGSRQAQSSDLYALAATFYHLISGNPPPSSHVRLAAAARQAEDPLSPLPLTLAGYDRHFCEAINHCLSIFPQDRLESAQVWRDMIDTERRRRRLLEKAKNDEELVRRIAEIVRQSRSDLAMAEPDEAPAAPIQPQFGPRQVIPPKPPARRPAVDTALEERPEVVSGLSVEASADAIARQPAPDLVADPPPPRPVRPHVPPRPVQTGTAVRRIAERDASQVPRQEPVVGTGAVLTRVAALRKILVATGRFCLDAKKFDSFSAQEAMK